MANSPLHNETSPLPAIRTGLSKTEVYRMAETVVDQTLDGAHDPVAVAEALAAMESLVKAVRADARFVDAVREAAGRQWGGITTASGARIEACETATRWDYSRNGDWCQLSAEAQALEARKKSLEEKLRAIPPGKTWVDDETGELLEGPLKTSHSTYRITLRK